MKINGQPYRTIWLAQDGWRVVVIDQTRLPFRFETVALGSAEQAADAIRSMVVRGAPLNGATPAEGVARAIRAAASE
jgi:methylthioribose-1-phosphate isomerase